MRRVFPAEFIRALVGRIADRDYLDIRMTLQRRQMAAAHNLTRPDNSEPQLVMIFLAHRKPAGGQWECYLTTVAAGCSTPNVFASELLKKFASESGLAGGRRSVVAVFVKAKLFHHQETRQ